MFDLSPEKVLVFLIIALVVLGPGRLGEVARLAGRARAQLRQYTDALSPEAAKMLRDPRGALRDALEEPKEAMAGTAAAARESIRVVSSPVSSAVPSAVSSPTAAAEGPEEAS